MRFHRLLLTAGVLAATSAPVRAQTKIDFEEFASPIQLGHAGPLISKGFQFTETFDYINYYGIPTHSVCTVVGCFGTTGSTGGNFAGSTGMFGGIPGWNTTMSKLGGGPFSITSIDVAQSGGGGNSVYSIIFHGDLIGGGTILQQFNYQTYGLGRPSYTHEVFGAGWTNLADFWWDAGVGQFGNGQVQVDNINLDQGIGSITAPEPASFLLVASGLLGVGMVARRRRRAA